MKYSNLTKLTLFSAFTWLFFAMGVAALASLKLHAETFLAGFGWSTYGILDAVSFDTLVYGFAGNLLLALGFLDRQARGSEPGNVSTLGVVLWNFVLLLGVVELIHLGSVGHRLLNFPGAVNFGLIVGFVLASYSAIGGLLRTQPDDRYVSHLFALVAFSAFLGSFWIAQTWVTQAGMLGIGLSLVANWYANVVIYVALPALAIAVCLRGVETHERAVDAIRGSGALILLWAFLIFGFFGGIAEGFPIGGAVASLSTVSTWFIAVGSIYFLWSVGPALRITANGGISWRAVCVRLITGVLVLKAIVSTRPFTDHLGLTTVWDALEWALVIGAVGILALGISHAGGSNPAQPQITGLKRWVLGVGLVFIAFAGNGWLDATFFLRFHIVGVLSLALLGAAMAGCWARSLAGACCSSGDKVSST